VVPYGQESLLLVYKRWKKLANDFYDKDKDLFDVSKIPEIFDMIRFDANHNLKVLEVLKYKPDKFYKVAS
jgi:hypothetical protein